MPIELVKVGLLEDGATSPLVMSTVQEGGEGATRQVFNTERVESVIEDNQVLADVHDFSLSVAGLNRATPNTSAILAGYVSSQSLVHVSGYTIDGHILSGSGYLSFRKGLGETYRTDIIEMSRRGQYGYDSSGETRSGIMLFQNLMAKYNVVDGSGGIMYGFLPASGITESFTAPTQTLDRDSGTNHFQSQNLFFPFTGAVLTASIDVLSISGDASPPSPGIRIQALDGDGVSILGSQTTTITGTGRKSVSYTLPEDTVYVNMSVFPGDESPAVLSFKHPSLRADGSTEFSLH